MAEEADGEPVEVVGGGGDALAGAVGEGQAEEAGLDAADGFFELVDFIFDDVEDCFGEGGADGALARGPLADHVDEGFLEDDFGAGKVAQAEVADGVFGDLFPEAGLELEEVVVDAGADDGEGVVLVPER